MGRTRLNYLINWKLWAGLIISALFLYIAFRQVDFSKTWETIFSCKLMFWISAVMITILQHLARAYRWAPLLHSLKKTGFKNRFLSVLIGFGGNCILPARLGEIVRANCFGEAEKISKSATLGTIVMERLFDGFMILLLLLIGLLYSEPSNEMLHIFKNLLRSAVLFLFLFLLIILVIVGLRCRTNLFVGGIEKLFCFLSVKIRSKLILTIQSFVFGLSPLKNFRAFLKTLMWTLLIWILSLVQVQLIGASIGIELPFITTFIIITMTAFGVMVPSAPGFIGTFHLSAQYGFMFFAVSAEDALSAATLLHASFFFPSVVLGVLAFIRIQACVGKIDIEEMAPKK